MGKLRYIILIVFLFLGGCKLHQWTVTNPDAQTERDFRYMYDIEQMYPYFDYYDYRYSQFWIDQVYTDYYVRSLNKYLKQVDKDTIPKIKKKK